MVTGCVKREKVFWYLIGISLEYILRVSHLVFLLTLFFRRVIRSVLFDEWIFSLQRCWLMLRGSLLLLQGIFDSALCVARRLINAAEIEDSIIRVWSVVMPQLPPPKFNSSPLESYRAPIGKDRLPHHLFSGASCYRSGVYQFCLKNKRMTCFHLVSLIHVFSSPTFLWKTYFAHKLFIGYPGCKEYVEVFTAKTLRASPSVGGPRVGII